MKFQKAFAVIGAGVILFAATDAVTYAATGSSLVLGQLNQANSVTTIQTTSTGSALRLLTAPSSPPMAVNGRGKVVNLYADRAAVADNAIQAGVIWVAKSGGQFTSLSAALASITNNGPEQRYVIKVAPGTYTETASVGLKNYVDVEGSGQGVTTITCACGSNTLSYRSSVLRVISSGLHVSVRGVTVNNTGSNLNYSSGIWTVSAVPGNVSLDDVTVTAAGGNVSYGIYNFVSSPRMTNVTATGTGGTDGYGVYQQGGSVLIRDSFLTGSTFSVRKVSGTIRILNTVFNGNTAGVGAAACIAALTTQLTDFICL